MIAEQNVVFTSHGPITVRMHHDARYRGVVALFDGDGTGENPLHFVFLACHADMADESPVATTERLTKELAEAVLTGLRNQQGDVANILRSSNASAVETGRYYSVMVGHLIHRQINLAALGEVGALRLSANVREVMKPNVVRIGEHAILNASFGIGFMEEGIQVTEFDLAEDEMLLMTIGERGGDTVSYDDVQALIENVVGTAQSSPPVVAVVR
jgi:hypothetical protein